MTQSSNNQAAAAAMTSTGSGSGCSTTTARQMMNVPEHIYADDYGRKSQLVDEDSDGEMTDLLDGAPVERVSKHVDQMSLSDPSQHTAIDLGFSSHDDPLVKLHSLHRRTLRLQARVEILEMNAHFQQMRERWLWAAVGTVTAIVVGNILFGRSSSNKGEK